MLPVPDAAIPPRGRAPAARPHLDADNLSARPSSISGAFFIASEAELDTLEDSNAHLAPRYRSFRKSRVDSSRHRPGVHSSAMSSTSSCSEMEPPVSHDGFSEILTPVHGYLSGTGSALSCGSSRRNSVAASSDFPDSSPSSVMGANTLSDTYQPPPVFSTSSPGLGPQLIMPSLTVPQRRPFSDAGRALGKLKILVAGSNVERLQAHPRYTPVQDPFLCGDPEQTAISHPGGKNASEVRYVKSHLASLLDKQVSDSDLCAFLEGGGGSIVDVVLYLLPHTGPSEQGLERINSLVTMTNVIPLIARSDELSEDELSRAKRDFREKLRAEALGTFSFVRPESYDDQIDIYAVSTTKQADRDIIDASVLMNSEYMPPLVSTELNTLVRWLFSVDGSAQLRHASALKCIKWRREQCQDASLRYALMGPRDAAQYAVTPVVTTNPFSQPRLWRRIELTNWADGLRQSLEAERMGQAMQHASTRDTVLYERQKTVAKRGNGRRKLENSSRIHYEDPLGLLQLGSKIRRHGGFALDLLPLFPSLGALACLAQVVYPEWGNIRDSTPLHEWCSAFR
ncbi:hypothetical protein S40293_00994 [Stachybotrys chartarum IBT 40293]|nr:hypothetical protein S40293_00994 [Stachybotrys chartarum IBT 40293]